MSSEELEDATSAAATADPQAEGSDAEEQETLELNLDVMIEEPSACERHVTVTISREDIDRYLDEAYSEMMPKASVPGFRAGRAPRKLVESRYRKDISEQVKGSLLMDSLGQLAEEGAFTAISEPDFDLDAVEIPEEGPMTFEFNIEVRPEFDLPDWQGLSIERPVHEFSKEEINQQLEQMLAKYGQLVPVDEAAQAGDYLTLDIRSFHEGKQIVREDEVVARIRPTLSFEDAELADFDKLMTGVQPDDERTATVTLSANASNEQLQGQEIELKFKVLDVKRLRLPELTSEFLQEMGEFESEGDLRDAIQEDLDRQLSYHQQQQIREQISEKLVESASWELPPAMLRRQSARELDRAVMELRSSGFGEDQIRARENVLRRNSLDVTARALKEHFILERIAEDQDIDVEDGDYDREIMLMAMQSGESPRRVRAQIEKRGLMDVLRNQIVERKVIGLVEEKAKFKDTPFNPPQATEEAVSVAVGGEEQLTELEQTKVTAGESSEAEGASDEE